MLHPGQFLFATLFFASLAPAAFGSELLLSQPQDELADPSSSLSIPVRPGDRVSIVAALYDHLDGGGWADRGRRAEEFSWQPGCSSSSPACPTVNVGSSVVVTIEVPICMPLGSTTFTVSMPNPPDGEGTPAAAHVTLSNSEPPSICPGGSELGSDAMATTSGMHANIPADVQAQQIAQAQNPYGTNTDPRLEQYRRNQEAWARAYADAPIYSNGAQRGFNYGDQFESGSGVEACDYYGNTLHCRHLRAPKKVSIHKLKRLAKKRRR